MAQVADIVAEFMDKLNKAIAVQARNRLAHTVIHASGGTNGKAPPAHWKLGLQRRRGADTKTERTAVSKGRRLQGQYLGRLRKLKGRNRLRVKAIARSAGVEAAIKLADKLAT